MLWGVIWLGQLCNVFVTFEIICEFTSEIRYIFMNVLCLFVKFQTPCRPPIPLVPPGRIRAISGGGRGGSRRVGSGRTIRTTAHTQEVIFTRSFCYASKQFTFRKGVHHRNYCTHGKWFSLGLFVMTQSSLPLEKVCIIGTTAHTESDFHSVFLLWLKAVYL